MAIAIPLEHPEYVGFMATRFHPSGEDGHGILGAGRLDLRDEKGDFQTGFSSGHQRAGLCRENEIAFR